MGIRSMSQVIEHISPFPVLSECKFKKNQKVMFTNDYGVVFGPHKIIGFDRGDGLLFRYGKHIYLDFDSYWCPVAESSLTLIGD